MSEPKYINGVKVVREPRHAVTVNDKICIMRAAYTEVSVFDQDEEFASDDLGEDATDADVLMWSRGFWIGLHAAQKLNETIRDSIQSETSTRLFWLERKSKM